MVEEKLSYTYIMNRLMSGNLEEMLNTLPEEILDKAKKMTGEIAIKAFSKGDNKKRWTNLYSLLPKDKTTVYFKSICRKFIRSFMIIIKK